MRLSPNEKFFVFMCRENADIAAARKLLEKTDGIEIVDGFSGTFRIRATQAVADTFKVAHPDWNVEPERYIPLPRVRGPRILKGPE